MEKNNSDVYLAKQKNILLSEKIRVENELESINKFPQYGDTEESNAQEVERFEGYKGLEISLKLLLGDIKIALENINQDKYGICSFCGAKIEPERLNVFPAAQSCVKCNIKQKK
jgi:RNA polymerase-binding transcription factor DksA